MSRSRSRAARRQQPNMQQLMKQAQKMQQQLEAAQAELAAAEVDRHRRRRPGHGDRDRHRRAASRSKIDPKAVDPDDVETLQDLVVAAVRDANRAADELAEREDGPGHRRRRARRPGPARLLTGTRCTRAPSRT